MSKIVTFGEVMLRLTPPGNLRYAQAHSFDAIFGGTEANVAVALAYWDQPAEYVTRLPYNDLADALLVQLRGLGVGTAHVARGGERLGIYFVEFGAMQRGSKVIYDRAHSAIASLEPGMINWRAAFADADWFHWSGITPALSEGAAAASLEALQVAREMGLTISCDLNYRDKLWNWGKRPVDVMPQLVVYTDLIVASDIAAERMLDIPAPSIDDPVQRSHRLCEAVSNAYPQAKTVGMTIRLIHSASEQGWSGVLRHEGVFYSSRGYHLARIVDRLGTGDAFTAGVIYGLRNDHEPQQIVEFATAASCLKHSIFGDYTLVPVAEVEQLVRGEGVGRVVR